MSGYRVRPVPDDDGPPPADLVHPAFDVAVATEPTELLVILSTQRSGSTLLCERLRAAGHCVAHEYFHPHRYMPMLAERGGAVGPDRRMDWAAYARFLGRARTTPNGVLGVNAHAKHLPYLMRALPHLPARRRLVTLRREGLLAQALSLAAARATGAWSSAFEPRDPWTFDAEAAASMLAEIQAQNAKIEAFAAASGWPREAVTYEALAADPADVTSRITGLPGVTGDAAIPIQQQADEARRAGEVRRFAEHLLTTAPFGVAADDLAGVRGPNGEP